jgi:predicted nucleotidyltransferase component of viral defense system
MRDIKNKLFHPQVDFTRDSFEKRIVSHGFKNIARIELFIWDLELFLQIQDILKERIVLKGGAAVQFYLPIEKQRTSVDIDMIFKGTKIEIEEVLSLISKKLNNNEGFFKFKEHKPKEPKTELPLFTYFTDVPSVLTEAELRSETSSREIKIEFFIDASSIVISKVMGKNLFAVESNNEYNILPINDLFADKLTTMGPNTIGIQDNRMDEQIKQLYDIWMLIKYNFIGFDLEVIRKKYLKRAEMECNSRHITFNIELIKADALRQLKRISEIDLGEDRQLKNFVNDFKSLYLNAKIDFSPASVAIAAEQIKLIYESIFINDINCSILKKALELEKILKLEKYSGIEKGNKTGELREILIKKYSIYSTINPKILKGKNLNRVFWAIVNQDNIKEMEALLFENT